MFKEIICGNSIDVLKTYNDGCVDLILTSPPYNFSMDYDTYNDNKKFDVYFNEFLFPIFDECNRLLKSGGRFIINIQPLFSEYLPTHHIISDYLRNKGLIWRNEIIWDKKHYCKLTAWGSWKSPSAPYLNCPWEFIEVFCKDNIKHKGEKDNIDITADEFKKFVNGKWEMTPETRMKQIGHPAMFPKELAYRCLKLFSFKNDVILDPFNGAGTTTLVAHELDRQYIGIDISEEYCNIAKERIKNIKKEDVIKCMD